MGLTHCQLKTNQKQNKNKMFNISEVESHKGWSPLNPGASVQCVIEDIKLDDKFNLDFVIKGTNVENPGSANIRFWANTFDVDDLKFKQQKADDAMKQIRQFLDAYLTPAELVKITGSTWVEFTNNLCTVMKASVEAKLPIIMNLVYKYNSDTNIDIPKYGAFISSEFNPKGLKTEEMLHKQKSADGVPYDRVQKLAYFGIIADGKPSGFAESGDDAFASFEKEDPFA